MVLLGAPLSVSLGYLVPLSHLWYQGVSMPTSLPRGWLLGLALWFASTAWLYAFMSQAQAEQSWELEQLRRETAELHREVLSCQVEARGRADARRPLAGPSDGRFLTQGRR